MYYNISTRTKNIDATIEKLEYTDIFSTVCIFNRLRFFLKFANMLGQKGVDFANVYS